MHYAIFATLLWFSGGLAMPGRPKAAVEPAARQPTLEYEAPAWNAARNEVHIRDRRNETGLLASASNSDIEKARAIVEAALEQVAEHNAARLAHPMRNKYTLNPRTSNLGKRDASEDAPPPPLFNITSDIRAAAALMAEVDAQDKAGKISAAADPGKWWMGNMDHSGGWPWGKNKDGFKVFRNVRD